MASSKRVLAFMAHPDDIEILAAGTLIRLKNEADCHVTLATSTSGDCGTMDHGPDEIARIRHAEARAAADLIGADYYNARCQDLRVMYDAPTLRRFVEIVRRARPDIVITHAPVDYMIDHENTSRLVRTACFSKGVPNFRTEEPDPAPCHAGIAHLYYADPVEGKDIYGQAVDPDFVIDVTPVMDLKEKMLCCHASQRKWLQDHHKMDQYVISMRQWSAQRGKTIGVEFGEGFRQHLGHSYPQDNLLLGLLK